MIQSELNDSSHPKKNTPLIKRVSGRLIGSITGPAVALAQAHVLLFDLPIHTVNTSNEDSNFFTFFNAVLMTNLFNPVLTANNVINYYKAAVEAGRQGGPAAIRESFEWLQMPVSTFFKPTKKAREMRCKATELDINRHHKT